MQVIKYLLAVKKNPAKRPNYTRAYHAAAGNKHKARSPQRPSKRAKTRKAGDVSKAFVRLDSQTREPDMMREGGGAKGMTQSEVRS